MNPLSYQIMIFVSLLHPHNPLTSLPLPRHSIHRAHSFFSLGRSSTVSTTPFRHTPIDKPLQRCLPTTYTCTFHLLLSVSMPRVSHTVPHTCELSPLFSLISPPHTPPPIYLVAGPLAPPPSSIFSVYPSRRASFGSNKWTYTERSPAIHIAS